MQRKPGLLGIGLPDSAASDLIHIPPHASSACGCDEGWLGGANVSGVRPLIGGFEASYPDETTMRGPVGEPTPEELIVLGMEFTPAGQHIPKTPCGFLNAQFLSLMTVYGQLLLMSQTPLGGGVVNQRLLQMVEDAIDLNVKARTMLDC